MTLRTTDPASIRISSQIYSLLLIAYPPPFRAEYGLQMGQVFRDCSLNAYFRSGIKGVLALWPRTILDWLKSVIEEQLNRATEMTRTKLVRLAGWGLICGPIALFIGLGDPADYRRMFTAIVGNLAHPGREEVYRFASETVPHALALMGMGLISFGFVGLYLAYRSKVGRIGQIGLFFSAASSIVAAVGGAYSITGAEAWWGIFLGGFLLMFLSLAVFGAATLQENPLPRWNALPLFTGLWFPGTLAIGIFLANDESPYFLLLPMAVSLL
jgi:hypothetical protein